MIPIVGHIDLTWGKRDPYTRPVRTIGGLFWGLVPSLLRFWGSECDPQVRFRSHEPPATGSTP